jgi:hypothetical protein
MFSVVPLSYNTVDDSHKARTVTKLDPIEPMGHADAV